eukprot:jgi/Bigna1/68505/fgenesh1_pg.6_\
MDGVEAVEDPPLSPRPLIPASELGVSGDVDDDGDGVVEGSSRLSSIRANCGRILNDNCSEALYVIAWFTCSILFSLYNKEVLGEKDPLCSVLCLKYRGKPMVGRLIVLSVRITLPTALIECAFVDSAVSFYTMVKATAPIFALFFGLLMGLEEPDAKVFGSVILIVLGLFMATQMMTQTIISMVVGNSEFNMTGFFLVFFATIISGLRWNLLQILVQGEESLPTPMHVLEVVAPISGVLILVLSLLFETPWDGALNPFFDSLKGWEDISLLGDILMTLPSSTRTSSVLMFMAFGALKEVLTVCFSVLIYGDVITTNSVFGMVLVLMGVVLYKYHRHSRSHQHQETTELSPSIRNNVAYEVASSINSGVNGRSPSSQVVKKDNNGPPTNPMEKKSLLDPQSRTSFDEM